MTLILSRGGRIDNRSNTIHTGENGQNTTNDQLMELYRDIIEDKGISMGMKTTLSKHYELISLDLVEIAK